MLCASIVRIVLLSAPATGQKRIRSFDQLLLCSLTLRSMQLGVQRHVSGPLALNVLPASACSVDRKKAVCLQWAPRMQPCELHQNKEARQQLLAAASALCYLTWVCWFSFSSFSRACPIDPFFF
jgi:hypothetical protein